MRISTVALKEMWHRKAGALVLLVGVSLCIALVVSFQRVSLGVIDELRKATLEMGQNIVILPAGVTMEQYWTGDFGDKTLPQGDVKALADFCSKGKVLARHFLGSLDREVIIRGHRLILSGIMVEIDIEAPKSVTQGAQKPLAPDEAELGWHAAKSVGLKEGDTVAVGDAPQARTFRIIKVRKETGTAHDYKVFVDIGVVQEMFATGPVVNVIEAVSCLCSPQFLPTLATMIEEQLFGAGSDEPRGRAYYFGAISEARRKAREGMMQKLDLLTIIALVFAALVVSGYSAWDARARRREMGLLLAIAVRPPDVAWLVLIKALIIGAAAGVLGCWLGDILVASYATSNISELHPAMRPYVFSMVGWQMYAIVVGASLVLTVVPSLVGVAIATNTDPAETLRET